MKMELDLWGGIHTLDTETRTYHLNRLCGLFSNITVAMYGILKYTSQGYPPSKLELFLQEYINQYDFYQDLFKQSDQIFSLDEFSKEQIDHALKYGHPTYLGLGAEKNHLNFEILDSINSHFFSVNKVVENLIREITINNNIEYENTVVIWARKTDKVNETTLPTCYEYMDKVERLNLGDKRLILQTDDPTVLDEFTNLGIPFDNLGVLPINTDTKSDSFTPGFHQWLVHVGEDVFVERYNMTKIQYLQRVLALVHVVSKCHTSILYPGNLATYVPILRKSWDNVVSFKDANRVL